MTGLKDKQWLPACAGMTSLKDKTLDSILRCVYGTFVCHSSILRCVNGASLYHSSSIRRHDELLDLAAHMPVSLVRDIIVLPPKSLLRESLQSYTPCHPVH
jgi:hypothetical protein